MFSPVEAEETQDVTSVEAEETQDVTSVEPEEMQDVTAATLLQTEMVSPARRHLSWGAKIGLGSVVASALLLLACVHFMPTTPLSEITGDVTLLAAAPVAAASMVAIPAEMVEVAPPREKCSSIGQSCKQSNCCTFSGYMCYEKDSSWSSCLKTCKAGQPNGDKLNKMRVQKPKPNQSGGIPQFATPFFKEAPPGPWTCKRTPNLKPARIIPGTTLFCFTVPLSKIGPKPAEKFSHPMQIDLVKTQLQTKTSIFGCERWHVFSDVSFELTPGPPERIMSTQVDFPKPVVRPKTKLWQNTLLYVNVWKKLLEQNEFKDFDWTVKVDTTTVFLPMRLRKILEKQKQTDNGVYLENCKYVRYGFHGSLEVVDKKAAMTYAQNAENCLDELPYEHAKHAHFSFMGEDKFMQRCMDRHGVDKIPSTYDVGNGPQEGLHTTVTCPAHQPNQGKGLPKKWKPPCATTLTAAMHAFKKPSDYFTCIKATQALDNPEFNAADNSFSE